MFRIATVALVSLVLAGCGSAPASVNAPTVVPRTPTAAVILQPMADAVPSIIDPEFPVLATARRVPEDRNGGTYMIPDRTAAAVIAWYMAALPRYGWTVDMAHSDPQGIQPEHKGTLELVACRAGRWDGVAVDDAGGSPTVVLVVGPVPEPSGPCP
jgi:hypothetical protein